MKKQHLLSINDNIYESLRKYASNQHMTMKSLVEEALLDVLSKKQPENKDGRFTFIDLFAGIGGMRLAFEKQGGVCQFSSEWDRYARQTYFDNFGEWPQGDITEIRASKIPNHDILVAGFPCQPFSIAGVSKKNSLGRATGFEDKTQGTLFFDVCRIIKEKRPKAFLLENVKNLKSHDKGNTWKVIRDSLSLPKEQKGLDYEVFEAVVDGQGFVPQHRERIFIIGFDRERYREILTPFEIPEIQSFLFDLEEDKPKKRPVLRDILDEDVDEKYTLSDKLWTYLQNYAEKHRAKGNGFGFGMPDMDGVTRTLSARYYKDGSEILINQGDEKNPRKLTPHECARLQGYPEDFKITVSDTRAYKQFGNSVVVPLVTAIAGKLVTELEELDRQAAERCDGNGDENEPEPTSD